MKKINTVIPLLVAGVLLVGMISGSVVFADENKRGEREKRHKSDRQYSVVNNPLYEQECSSCHFLYLPGLLPERSWQEIMKSSGKHFGEDLALDDTTKEEILSYLSKYSAEKSNTEWAGKILASIGSGTPVRITETQYIKRKHRKIKTEVFKRPSIGSFSNCGACHKKGAQGDFEEDGVSIPK
ncbi:MAG: diheme cytochrome c [Nitrospirae bacterium]|nr:diheme cytochrome c [Nitrospirota bacterium]